MTRKQREEYSTFQHVVYAELDAAKNETAQVYKLLDELCSLAKTAEHYNVAACNYGLTSRQEKRSAKVDARAEEIGRILGLKILTNGDPRGYAFKVLLPLTNRYNTWGGAEEGWGVPQV